MGLTKVSTDGVKDDAITSGKIPANAVGASELADNAVDTNAIANNAVTAGKTSGVQTTINNNADNRVITGSGTSNTLEGEQYLTWNGSTLGLQKSGSGDVAVNIEVGNGTSQSRLLFSDNSAVDGTVTYDHNDRKLFLGAGTSNPTDGDITINSSGKVGIGMTNPDDTLDVNGTFQVSSNSYMSNLYMSGNLFIGGTGAANALDDYEKGTWTPALKFSNQTTGYTTSVAQGSYQKIGDLVYCKFVFELNGGSANVSGTWEFHGLPYTVSNDLANTGQEGFGQLTYWNNISNAECNFMFWVQDSGTTFNVMKVGSSGTTTTGNATHSDVTSTTQVRGSLVYMAS